MATKAPKDVSKTAQDVSETALTVAATVPIALYGKGSGAVLPAAFAAELAAEAKDAAATERPSISRISLRAGIMSYNGQPIAGNNLPCVIMYMSYERAYYTSAFDPDNIVSPDCFALSDDAEEEMRPHENVLAKQNDVCLTCPKNEWGSDIDRMTGKPKRGKACKERRRLVLLPLSALNSPDELAKAEMALLSLPVTSTKNYSQFVNVLSATVKVPPYCVVTNISVVPDMKTQFQVRFDPQSVIADSDILAGIRARREDAQRIAMMPFDPKVPEEDNPLPESTKKAKY